MPQSTRELRVTFSSQKAGEYSASLLCDVSGRVAPLPLTVCGRARCAQVDFSFYSLDVGRVFVTAQHTYELLLANKGPIDALFTINQQPVSEWTSCFSFTPEEGLISPQGYQAVKVTICSAQSLGVFCHTIEFMFDGCDSSQRITFW